MDEGYYVKLEDEHHLSYYHQNHEDHIPTSLLIYLYAGHFLARWGARFYISIYLFLFTEINTCVYEYMFVVR